MKKRTTLIDIMEAILRRTAPEESIQAYDNSSPTPLRKGTIYTQKITITTNQDIQDKKFNMEVMSEGLYQENFDLQVEKDSIFQRGQELVELLHRSLRPSSSCPQS